MGITMILLWGLVIAGIVALVRYLGHSRTDQAGDGQAVQGSHAQKILAERFARGEIDAEEYRRRLDQLKEPR